MKKEQDKPILSDKEIDDAVTQISQSVIGINFNALGLFDVEVNIGYTDFTNKAMTYDAIEAKITKAWHEHNNMGSSNKRKPTLH